MQLPFSTLPSPRTHRVDAAFAPPHCPNFQCRSRSSEPFEYVCAGTYQRAYDLRIVQRYRCLVCRQRFSSQTFRVDYRLRKPWLPLAVFQGLVAKTSLRQISRSLGCKLDTVLNHLRLVGLRGHELHGMFLARCVAERSGLSGTFQLDELETFERSRRIGPLTVPVLVHGETWFVVASATGTLPARGRLSQFQRIRKERWEELYGKRKNGSRAAVVACARKLRDALGKGASVTLRTDMKSSYPGIFREVFGKQAAHQWTHSSERRDRKCLLFTVNHTLAQMRDGMGRLVRRSWGHSKLERNLGWHLGAWMLWRNYVREITCWNRGASAASALGVVKRRMRAREMFEWRGILPEAS